MNLPVPSRIMDDLWYKILTLVSYGNWTGYDYSAGQHGLEELKDSHRETNKPDDLLDAVSMRHDYVYDNADKSKEEAIANSRSGRSFQFP